MATVSVYLDSNVKSVTGTINGEEYVFALVDDNTWSVDATPSPDNFYHVSMTVISNTGRIITTKTTLYDGLLLITDRSPADVERYKELKEKNFDDMTADEQIEWMSNLRGAYNFTDMNRVEAAIEHIIGRLSKYYYFSDIDVREEWNMQSVPRAEDVARYLRKVRVVRNAFATLKSTPDVPPTVSTYQHANAIEQILVDVDTLITNMARNLCYVNDVYIGEGVYL